MSWQVLVPIVAVFVTPAFSYLSNRWRSSGRIGTTEADRLWAEATSMRAAYQADAVRLREEVAELAAVRAERDALRAEAVAWRAEAAQLRVEAAVGREELARLREEQTP